MSPAEKRYFRLHFASEANQLTELFDTINRMSAYDEAALKLKLDPTTAKNLKVYKSQLTDLLLKSLTAFHSKRNIRSKVRMLLEEADILAEKQLFDQALDRLAKAKSACKLYEEYTYLLEISAREFHLQHVSNDRIGISGHPYFEEAETFIRHIKTSLDYHKSSSEWIDHLRRINYRPSGGVECKNARDLLDKERKVSEAELSFRAKLSRNTLLMSAYRMVNDLQSEGACREANVQLFQEYPQFQETMPFHYIAVLRNFMNFGLVEKNFDAALACVHQGLEIIARNPQFASQTVYFHFGALEVNFETGNWSSLLNEWEKPVMAGIEKQQIGRERIAMLCYLYFALSYQILEKPARVQHYLRKAAECRDDVKRYFAELISLLDLINHYESGDDFLVKKQIKALKRKQSDSTTPYSPLFFEILQIFACCKPEERSSIAAGLLERQSEWEASHLGYMLKKNGLHHWIQAVACGRSFAEEMNAEKRTFLGDGARQSL